MDWPGMTLNIRYITVSVETGPSSTKCASALNVTVVHPLLNTFVLIKPAGYNSFIAFIMLGSVGGFWLSLKGYVISFPAPIKPCGCTVVWETSSSIMPKTRYLLMEMFPFSAWLFSPTIFLKTHEAQLYLCSDNCI